MTETPEKPQRGGPNWLILVPPIAFVAIATMFLLGLNREAPDSLPSAFAGRQAPALDLPPLNPGAQGPTTADLAAPGVKLVNFWASWCSPCRVEHPLLTEVAEAGVPIIGVNYKDSARNAQGFLDELGDPFVTVGVDDNGRTGIDWGLYGVPETFVIDGEGTVLLRHAGPITREIYERRFAPLLTE